MIQTYRYIEDADRNRRAARASPKASRSPGETIAITSGMPIGAGSTNFLKIHTIGTG